jgi:hypothetical protein
MQAAPRTARPGDVCVCPERCCPLAGGNPIVATARRPRSRLLADLDEPTGSNAQTKRCEPVGGGRIYSKGDPCDFLTGTPKLVM